MSGPRLSVIIVTWNVEDLIVDCIGSIEQTAGDLEYEVIVVDNASTDGSARVVAERFPNTRLIRNEINVGFPRANNQALEVARGEYVLYLNPDTKIGPGTLTACVEELDRSPDVGMVGCRLDLPDGRIQPECARRAFRLRHLLAESLYFHMFFPRSRLFGDLNMGWWDHRGTRDVEAIVGAFMMVRRAVANEVGGLPEELFMYHEDMSFCLRVRRLGWRIRYRGDVGTLHYTGQSAARSNLHLELLALECRLLLIKELQGPLAALAGRVVWSVAGALRFAIALSRPLFPAAARRYPRVFHARGHLYEVIWCIAPWTIAGLLPRTPSRKLPLSPAPSA